MHEKKEQILMHLESSIECAKKLMSLTEAQWRMPIAKEKWSIAEVIGHFAAWDRFLLEERIPLFFSKGALLPAPNENVLNEKSASESRTMTKEEIIAKFVAARRSLVIAVNNLDDELWEKSFKVGRKSMTLHKYFMGLIEHDEHHFKQVQELVNTFKT